MRNVSLVTAETKKSNRQKRGRKDALAKSLITEITLILCPKPFSISILVAELGDLYQFQALKKIFNLWND